MIDPYLYEEREKMLAHRASILTAEAERLAGTPTYTVDDVRTKLKEKYSHAYLKLLK